MKWFNNLKMQRKLLVGFILIAMMAGIVGGVGVFSLWSVNAKYSELYLQDTVPLEYLENAAVAFQRTRLNMYRVMVATSADDQQTYYDRLQSFHDEMETNLATYELTISTQEETKLYSSLTTELKSYIPVREKVLSLAMGGKSAAANEYAVSDEKPYGTTVDEAIDSLYTLKLEQAANTYAYNTFQVKIITGITSGLTVLIVVLAVAASIVFARKITRPLLSMVTAAEKLALGDIEVDVSCDTTDEIGTLSQAFGSVVKNIQGQARVAEIIAAGDLSIEVPVRSEKDILGIKLEELVDRNGEVLGKINSAAELVLKSSLQVSDSSQNLAQGSVEQASAIEEISASINEMARQTKENTQKAEKASDLAAMMKDVAEQGNSHMEMMLTAMSEIRDSSNDISTIIKLIEDIAFQTNILALNAAVEAARAGQAGKGFAVVAEEVKNLAGKSAVAAKDTAEKIAETIGKTNIGSQYAEETSDALHKITAGIGSTAECIGEIAQMTNQQSEAIAQIDSAISQVAQVVQNISATSEETAAESEELSQQSKVMRELVSRYKLKS